MTSRRLPNWLDSFIEYTENSEPPESFRLWTGISTVASMLKRKCFINWGHLRFFPNLYIILVAPPGQARKGTAISFGVDFTMKAGIKMCADSTTKEALVRKLAESMETIVDSNSTDMTFHCSYTIVSPELTSLLGGGDSQMISWLTDWFDCGKGPEGIWEYTTKHQGEDRIAGIWVNLLGATTPDLIGKIPDIIGSGLSSRIIFVYEPRHGKICAEEPVHKSTRLGDDLYHDLEQILIMQGQFKLSDGFKEVWVPWYGGQMNDPPFKDKRLARYCTRRGTHIMKISMVMSASQSSEMIIRKRHLLKAIKVLEFVERKMHFTFGSMGDAFNAGVINAIMVDIGTAKKITARELMNRHYYDIGNPRNFDDIIRILERKGFCRTYQVNGQTMVEHLKGEPDEY